VTNKLEFSVRSGGTISIALELCEECQSKSCLEVCAVQGGPLVLDKVRDVPALRWALPEIERGGCVECLGCELDCELYGSRAVTVELPMNGFDEYLDSLGQPVVWER
jgi:hypothetical protein